MKNLLVSALSIWLLSGCAQLEGLHREREVAPRRAGDAFAFKIWPGSSTTYTLTLKGVKEASATLGPDFTVHYFALDPDTSLALYNGGNPRSGDDQATTRFRAMFGSKSTEWSIAKREADFRAEACVPAGEHSFWHLIIIAPTEQRVRELAEQLGSFRQHEQPRAPATVNKALAATSGAALSHILSATSIRHQISMLTPRPLSLGTS